VRVRRLEQDEAFEIDTPTLLSPSFVQAPTRSTSTKPAIPPSLVSATVKAKSPVAATAYTIHLGNRHVAGIDELDAHSELRL